MLMLPYTHIDILVSICICIDICYTYMHIYSHRLSCTIMHKNYCT